MTSPPPRPPSPAPEPVAEPTVTVADKRGGPNLLIRALWFVFVGWWLSFSVISLAGLATITVIGIPLGLWLANRIPQVATLKLDRTRFIATAHADGAATISISGVPQRPFWQRALWFALVGWWLTYLWLYLAWALCITIILMPVAFPMFSAAGKLLTLKRG